MVQKPVPLSYIWLMKQVGQRDQSATMVAKRSAGVALSDVLVSQGHSIINLDQLCKSITMNLKHYIWQLKSDSNRSITFWVSSVPWESVPCSVMCDRRILWAHIVAATLLEAYVGFKAYLYCDDNAIVTTIVLCRSHCNVNTFNFCHYTHFYRCSGCHQWVLLLLVAAAAVAQCARDLGSP